MAFHFTLRPLLRLRQSIEERERQRLLVLNGRLNQEHQKLQQLKHDRIRAADRLAEAMRECLGSA